MPQPVTGASLNLLPIPFPRDLNVTLPEPFFAPDFISVKASMLGAIYVLEGSRLGGAVLKRTVPGHFPRRFLEARQAAGSWRTLLQALDEFLIRDGSRKRLLGV